MLRCPSSAMRRAPPRHRSCINNPLRTVAVHEVPLIGREGARYSVLRDFSGISSLKMGHFSPECIVKAFFCWFWPHFVLVSTERCIHHPLSVVSTYKFVCHLTYGVFLGMVYLLIQSWGTPQVAVQKLKITVMTLGQEYRAEGFHFPF